mgnify:CR=1 FL=1
MQACTGRARVGCARTHGRRIGRIDLLRGASHKANVNSGPRRDPLAQPELHAPIAAKAFEVGMAWRSIFAVVVEPILQTKWRENPFVKLD